MRKALSWVAVVGAGVFTTVIFAVVLIAGLHAFWNDVALKHVPTIIGLPAAAIASLGLVLLLRTVAGNIETKALGFEFKGAAGPIVMWILCFLAITLAINKTWDLDEHSEQGKVVTMRQ